MPNNNKELHVRSMVDVTKDKTADGERQGLMRSWKKCSHDFDLAGCLITGNMKLCLPVLCNYTLFNLIVPILSSLHFVTY